MPASTLPEKGGIIFQRVKRLYKRGERVDESSAPGVIESVSPLVLPVVGNVKLIKVVRGQNRTFSPEDIEHIFCLELGGDQFSVQEAIDWVRGAHDIDPSDNNTRVPTIVVLANTSTLSVEELDRIQEELIPSGAIFAPWVAGSRSFVEAFHALRDQIKRNYGPPDFSNAAQWGGSPSEVRSGSGSLTSAT